MVFSVTYIGCEWPNLGALEVSKCHVRYLSAYYYYLHFVIFSVAHRDTGDGSIVFEGLG